MADDTAARPDLALWRPDWDFGPIDEFPLYTRANIGEVIPGIISPLNASAGGTALDRGFVILGQMLGLWDPFLDQMPPEVARGEGAAYVGVFYGKAYLNLSLLTMGAELLPGSSSAALEEQYLGGVRHPGAAPRRLSFKERRAGLAAVPRYLRAMLRGPRLAREQGQRVDAFVTREEARDLRALDDEALLTLLDHGSRFSVTIAALHLFNSASASSGLEQLAKAVALWLPGAPAGLTERLVTGLPNVESAKPAYELWRLSRMVLTSPALFELFERTDAGALEAALRAAPGEEAAMFRAALARFLKQYGYRALRETEIATKPWSQDPAFVYATVKSYLNLGDDADPFVAHERQAAARREAEAYAFARLNPIKRAVFRQELQLAQTYVALRELTKAQWVRAIGIIRLYCQEFGRRFAARGLLADAEDVFLLMLDDLHGASGGRLSAPAVRALVEARRQQVAWCEQIELPEWFEGMPAARWADAVAAAAGPPAAAFDGEVLKGIAVSPGRVRGRARVITELDDESSVELGEILVAPFTDAAWTPLFFAAAGVVVDLGGPLSHGSTVAREYGLPAVVNVKTGTTRIRTGQEITVDGTAGEVVLHAP